MNRKDRFLAILNKHNIPEFRRDDIMRSFIETDPMNLELVKLGYPDSLDFDTDNDYLKKVGCFDDKGVEVLLSWLPRIENKSLIIDYLRYTKNKFDGSILKEVFDLVNDDIQWQICDLITANPPHKIKEWVKDLYFSKKYGFSVDLTALAIPLYYSKLESSELLQKGFVLRPEITVEALVLNKNKTDAMFLKTKLDELSLKTLPNISMDKKEVIKIISKAIIRLEKMKK